VAKSTSLQKDLRVEEVAERLTRGYTRSTLLRYCADKWGVSPRQVDNYIRDARILLKEDWNEMERDQMIAEVLCQYNSLQVEARERGQLAVALGCIHGAAKVAKLISGNIE
jgi:predicted transcriptional regulator